MKPYNSMYKKEEGVKEAAEVKEVEKVNTPKEAEAPKKVEASKEIEKVEAPKAAVKPSAKKSAKVVGCTQLNVRKDPNVQASIIEILDAGAKVETYGTEKDFTKVHTQRGMNGFCMTEYLEEVK